MAGSFITVRCGECDNEQTVFGKASSRVSCGECGTDLATPTGGKATIHGEVVAVVEER